MLRKSIIPHATDREPQGLIAARSKNITEVVVCAPVHCENGTELRSTPPVTVASNGVKHTTTVTAATRKGSKAGFVGMFKLLIASCISTIIIDSRLNKTRPKMDSQISLLFLSKR